MYAFFGAFGLIGIVAGIVLLIIALIKKRKKKTGGLIFLVSFAVFVIAVAMTPVPDENPPDLDKVETSASVDTQLRSSKVTVQEYEDRISQALKEMGKNTRIEIVSSELQEDGKTLIRLGDYTSISLTTNNEGFIEEALLTMAPEAYYKDNEDFDFSFILLVGTIDETLDLGDRYLLIRELGLDNNSNLEKSYSKVHSDKGIKYTYKGNPKEDFKLLAEFK